MCLMVSMIAIENYKFSLHIMTSCFLDVKSLLIDGIQMDIYMIIWKIYKLFKILYMEKPLYVG